MEVVKHVTVCAIGGRPLGAADREFIESSLAYIKAQRRMHGGLR